MWQPLCAGGQWAPRGQRRCLLKSGYQRIWAIASISAVWMQITQRTLRTEKAAQRTEHKPSPSMEMNCSEARKLRTSFGVNHTGVLDHMATKFSSVQSLGHVWHFVTPWTTAHQASLSITYSQSVLKLMSIKSVMPSNHLILCRPLLFLPSIFPSIRVFSNESVLCIRWPKYWSFSFSISPPNEYSGLISFRMD